MIDRKIAPPIVDAVDFKLTLKPYEKHVLDNGVPVFVVDAGAEDVLMVEWLFYAGNAYEQQTGVAAATNFMLRNGTTHRTALEINEAFEFYGAFCNRNCFNETSNITLHTLGKHAEKLLPVVAEMISDSIFPESELEIYKQNSIQKLAVSLQKCEFVAGRAIDTCIYGESHPYGRQTNASDISALTREQLVSFYKQYYYTGKCALFVAGKIPDGFVQLLNRYFGKLPLIPADFSTELHTALPGAEKKIRIHNDPNAVQGAIRLAAPFANRHHPDFTKAIILNNLFGGFFGSRLMRNIREEKGYTYGIYSYLQNHIQQSAWTISTEAGKDVCEATIAEVYKEMKLLREKPVEMDELSLVRNYMMGSILGDLDGPFHIIARWKNIILNNLPEQYFYDSMHAIRTTSPEELMELANKYLHPEKFYEVVVY